MISIIVPCFNSSGTIRETLTSALEQDCEKEIIAVNDGSTDDTLDKIRKHSSDITILDGPNRGVSAARNWGIEHAKGDWIVFLDSDDLLEPDALTTRRELAEEAQADVVLSGWSKLALADGEWRRGPQLFMDPEAIRDDPEIVFARDVCPPPAAILYSRRLAKAVGGFRPDFPIVQDVRFLFDCARAGASFAMSRHVGALYRVQGGSLSRRSTQAFWSDVLRNCAEIERLWLAENSLTDARRQALGTTYNEAAKQLAKVGEPSYSEAVAALRRLSHPFSPANAVFHLLERAVGLRAASELASYACAIKAKAGLAGSSAD